MPKGEKFDFNKSFFIPEDRFLHEYVGMFKVGDGANLVESYLNGLAASTICKKKTSSCI